MWLTRRQGVLSCNFGARRSLGGLPRCPVIRRTSLSAARFLLLAGAWHGMGSTGCTVNRGLLTMMLYTSRLAPRRPAMIRLLTFTAAAVFSVAPIAITAAQPDQALPPPPGVAPAQYAAPTKSPAQSPVQSPTQAPAVAACAPQTVTCTVMVPQTTYK